MKSFRVLFLLLTTLFFSCSCEQPAILSVSQTALTFGNGGGSTSVSLTANKIWTASSNQSWLRVSPSYGDGSQGFNTSVSVSCEANDSYDERTGIITFTSEDLTTSITVTQAENEGLSVSQTEFNLTNEAQTITVDVLANVLFSVEIDNACKDWVKYNTTKSLSKSTVVLDIAGNGDYDGREGKVIIKQVDGALSATIIIRQGQLNGLFLTTSEYVLSNEKHSLTVEVKSNIDFEVKPEVGWIKYVETKGLKTNQIFLEVEANEDYDAREGKVMVKQRGGDLEGIITVKQDEKYGLLLSQTEFDVSNEAHSIVVEVKSNVDYAIVIPEGCKDWISLTQTKSLNSRACTFLIAENKDYNDDRDGSITFKQKDGPLSGTVTIRQSRANGLFVTKSYYELSDESQTISVEIKSNVVFEVRPAVDWITYVETKGLVTNQILLNVSENNTGLVRVGDVSVTQKNGGLSGTIRIKQAPKQSPIDPTDPSEPHFSETVELLCLVWRLAGATEFNRCLVPEVYNSADTFFAPVKDHPAVQLASEYRKNNISYDAVTGYGLFLEITDQGDLVFNTNYIKESDNGLVRWTDAQMQIMLPLLNDFYHQSHFHDWFMSMEPLQQQAIKSFQTICNVDYEWFDRFFGPVADMRPPQIILSILIGENNHGHSVVFTDGTKMLTPVIGSFKQGSLQNVFFYAEGDILIHELCHPYCNPLMEQYFDLISEKASAVFQRVSSKMNAMAYNNAQVMMNESFVRSSVIQYYKTHSGVNPNNLMQQEVNKGFLLVPTMVEALGIREDLQFNYATMDDFMPELAKAINAYDGVVVYPATGKYDEYTNPSATNLLPGIFSVSPSKRVQFTKGNLYWNGQEWRFEENQMNYPNRWDPYHVGHLYWVAKAEDAYLKMPNKTISPSVDDHHFCDGSDEDHLLTVEGTSGLRILLDGEDGELGYLLYGRPNAKSLFRYPVEIKGVGLCIVFAPDDYSGGLATSYDAASWAVAEKEGLVCLTTAGYRGGDTVSCSGYDGWYWTGSPHLSSERYAYMLMFNDAISRYANYSVRNACFSIRLVKDVE